MNNFYLKCFWEVDDIDLNLRHYSGKPSDVIKNIKSKIEVFLSNPDVPYQTRAVYSAIYNALDYYKNISYIPGADFSTDDTFLSYSIENFNRDFEYLSSKYNSSDPTILPVISLNCRIKSPLGFVEKVKLKISEYLRNGRDLSYFNESLRDLMGTRIIVDPPEDIKAQGPQAESDFLYKVFYDLMQFHGIDKQNQDTLDFGDYSFIPVDTRHSPNKSKTIKERPQNTGFSDNVPLSEGAEHYVFVPEHRIPEVEQSHVDSILKDYNRWPKYSGYQSLHTCVVPYYSDYIKRLPTPPYIIPSASNDYTIEYQIRTKKQNDYAERGAASHKFSYKPGETLYHRLAVPFYIDFDSPEDLEELQTRHPARKTLRLRNFAESYRRFYGHSFRERFNINFTEFRDRFSSKERDEVLAGKKVVLYDETRDLYYLQDGEYYIFLENAEQKNLNSIIIRAKSNSSEVIDFLDKSGVTDGIIESSHDNTYNLSIGTKNSSHRDFKIFSKNDTNSLEKTSKPIDKFPKTSNNKDDYEPNL